MEFTHGIMAGSTKEISKMIIEMDMVNSMIHKVRYNIKVFGRMVSRLIKKLFCPTNKNSSHFKSEILNFWELEEKITVKIRYKKLNKIFIKQEIA